MNSFLCATVPTQDQARLTPGKSSSPAGTPDDLDAAVAVTEAAAKRLGLNDTDAAAVGRSGLIAVAGKTVSLTPLPGSFEGSLFYLIGVHTGCRVAESGSAALIAMLQHAPGILVAFMASIGVSPDAEWLLHRSVLVAADDAQAFAEAILGSVQLAEFVLDADGATRQ